jgi:hypothetical protein
MEFEENRDYNFGEFENFTGFMGHEGFVALCLNCGAILHRNLMEFYPHKNCFNCKTEFSVIPFFIAEGIWWLKKNKKYDVVSFDAEINKKDNYIEIELSKLPETLPSFWKIKNDNFPNTDSEKFSKMIFYQCSSKYKEDFFEEIYDATIGFNVWCKENMEKTNGR